MFVSCRAQMIPETGSASVFAVRHAEKADPSDPDTPLSADGVTRAGSLAVMMKNRKLVAVYATEFRRTQETAQPAARQAGLEVEVIKNADRALLIERARNVPKGSSVLIVGHSNTVPAIVGELSGEQVDGIAENEFDNLFEIVFEADGHTRLVRSRYGAPSH